MKIAKHRFADHWVGPSPHVSKGAMTPRFVVMHYTAGWSGERARDWFLNPKSKVSAHVVIDRDGTVWNLVPFDTAAWHAGPSAYGGYTSINKHSIGIELDNPGYVMKRGDRWEDWRGTLLDMDKVAGRRFEAARHPGVPDPAARWCAYPDAQLEALDRVVEALLAAYPSVRHIVGHEHIDTRKRKVDPGPLFPYRRYRMLLDDRHGDTLGRLRVTARHLNLRGGPGTGFETLDEGPLKRGDEVEALRREGDWVQVRLEDGTEAWAYGAYLLDV